MCHSFIDSTSSSYFAKSLWGILVGHFLSDGMLKKEHFSFTSQRHDFLQGSEVELFTQIAEIFTYEGNYVVDATCTKG